MTRYGSVHVNEEGLNEAIAQFGVWCGPISYKIVAKLEKILAEFYADTQARTHVITGSLKASGIPDSDYDADKWEGSITYGGTLWRGPAPGPPNDPVDYAIYEMARGGDHDFFKEAPYYIEKFEEVVEDFIPEAR